MKTAVALHATMDLCLKWNAYKTFNSVDVCDSLEAPQPAPRNVEVYETFWQGLEGKRFYFYLVLFSISPNC